MLSRTMVIKPGLAIRQFLKLESASGIILIMAAALALLLDNSPLSGFYDALLQTPTSVSVGNFGIAKPLLLWINDGLMAIFFLLIGLEVKREVLHGQLSSLSQIALPGVAAMGGIAVPVGIYVWLNRNDPAALNGWAIPAATDIAFALGILSLLGKRVLASLKVFLLTLAILDDLAAISIIAVFYSGDLNMVSLLLAAAALAALFIMNRLGVMRIEAYALVGVALWVFVLKSGVHATLAGVALAFAIPICSRDDETDSPVCRVEHSLHPWVAFGILPVFAFANAGITLWGISPTRLLRPVPLGIAAGLFIGKQLGVFGFSWLGVKAGLARLPDDVTWTEMYGISTLCGIGFTMSLFISSLAFEHGATDYMLSNRLGIITGSLLSAVWGYSVLRYATRHRSTADVPEPTLTSPDSHH